MKKESTGVKNNKRFRHGTYATVLTVLVILAVVLVNVGIGQLATNLGLQFDLTRNARYTLGETSKDVIKRLEKDIVIYAMYNEEDNMYFADTDKLIQNFANASDKIEVVYIDVYDNPQFANQFLSGTTTAIGEGNLIVTRTDHSKFRVLDDYDLYSYEYDSTYYTYNKTAFAGEEAVASALLYADGDESSIVYFLTGHGETDINDYYNVRVYLEEENYMSETIDTTALGTLTENDTLVISSPTRDITEDELRQLVAYAENGGRIIYLSSLGAQLTNFELLLGNYGVVLDNNAVYESDPNHYYGTNSMIVPALNSHEITTLLSNNDLSAYILNSRSISTADMKNANLVQTPLLLTSDVAYTKTDLTATDTTKTVEDEEGQYTLAMAVQVTNGENEDSTRMVVFGASDFATSVNYYGGNIDLFLNSVRWVNADDSAESVTIVGKSLVEDTLAFTSQSQMMISAALVVIIIPAIILVCGVVVFIRRRHL